MGLCRLKTTGRSRIRAPSHPLLDCVLSGLSFFPLKISCCPGGSSSSFEWSVKQIALFTPACERRRWSGCLSAGGGDCNDTFPAAEANGPRSLMKQRRFFLFLNVATNVQNTGEAVCPSVQSHRTCLFLGERSNPCVHVNIEGFSVH